MRHNDKETAELSQDVIELSDKLATLKRQHEQLRAAAKRYRAAKLSGGRREQLESEFLLDSALDATSAEPKTDP